MINELVIHLGDTKTGSSSIQKALVKGLCKAPGVSLFYPSRNHHNALAHTLGRQRSFDQRETRFIHLLKNMSESTADIGIISAEHFQFIDPLVLQDAIETYWSPFRDRLRLVAYVRPHGGKLLSAFSERVKLGAPMESLEDFFETVAQSQMLDYTPRFSKWREVFGSRFELRPFVRDRLWKGDAVQDFFRYLLGGEDFELTGEIAANRSLTLSQLALLRLAHQQLSANARFKKTARFSEAQGAMGRLISEHLDAGGLGQDGDKLRMPASIATRFKDRFAADAEALDAAFFDGFPMSDALEAVGKDVTTAKQSVAAEDHFDATTIASIRVFSNVLADLLVTGPNRFKAAVADIRTADTAGRVVKRKRKQ